MKKSLFTIALLTASIGSAHAYTPAIGGNWAGSLDFNGVILDEAPIWQFEVPSDAENKAANLDVNIYSAVEDSGNYIWDLDVMNDVVILSGETMAAIANGGPDLAPEITMGPDDTVIDGTDSAPTEVELEATGDSGEVGTLVINLKRADAIGYFDGSTGHIVANDGDVAQAATTLTTVVNFGNDNSTAWDGVTPSAGTNVFAELADANNLEIFAATDVVTHSTELTFTQADTPDVWEASLPIVVTIK